MNRLLIELVSEKVHNTWMDNKKKKGISSRKLDTTGEELMVSYDKLSEEAKDLDRGSVKATLDAIKELGFKIIKT